MASPAWAVRVGPASIQRASRLVPVFACPRLLHDLAPAFNFSIHLLYFLLLHWNLPEAVLFNYIHEEIPLRYLAPYSAHSSFSLNSSNTGTSLVVQWLRLLAPKAGGPGSIPGHGTRSHMLQLKVPYDVTKTQRSQINMYLKSHPNKKIKKSASTVMQRLFTESPPWVRQALRQVLKKALVSASAKLV